jgi:hypothetical protein
MKSFSYIAAFLLLWFVSLAFLGFAARIMWESLRLGWNLL